MLDLIWVGASEFVSDWYLVRSGWTSAPVPPWATGHRSQSIATTPIEPDRAVNIRTVTSSPHIINFPVSSRLSASQAVP